MATLTMYQTTVGKKVVMAVTGFILVLFVIVHMLGNLHAFEGAAEIDAYGLFLRQVGGPVLPHELALWIVRVILLVSVVLHIWSAWSLSQRDVVSRPVGYAMRRNIAHGYFAWLMRWGGLLIAIFIVVHLLQFTTGTILPGFVEGKVYHNLLIGFSSPLVVAFYVVAMLALGLHLLHGTWSMFHTLGLNDRSRDLFWRRVAGVVAVVVTLGFISVPLAVAVGVLR